MDEDYIEIRAIYNLPSLVEYRDWTKVRKLLGYGLVGVERREVPSERPTSQYGEQNMTDLYKNVIKPTYDM